MILYVRSTKQVESCATTKAQALRGLMGYPRIGYPQTLIGATITPCICSPWMAACRNLGYHPA